MEINQEALDALSLADLFALENHCDQTLELFGPNEPISVGYKKIKMAVVSETSKRISNVFIF